MKTVSHARGGSDHLAMSGEKPALAPDALIDPEGDLDGMFNEMVEHVGLTKSRTYELSVQMFDALVAQQLGGVRSR